MGELEVKVKIFNLERPQLQQHQLSSVEAQSSDSLCHQSAQKCLHKEDP